MEHCSTIENVSFAAAWMDLEIIILSELRQKEKDEYHMISCIRGVRFFINVYNVTHSNFQRTELHPITRDTDSSRPQRKAMVVTAH